MHTAKATACRLLSSKDGKRHTQPCPGAERGGINLVTVRRRSRLQNQPYRVLRMVKTLRYLRFWRIEEGRGFSPGTIDRFVAASMTLLASGRNRPPGISGEVYTAGNCPNYTRAAAPPLPNTFPTTLCQHSATTMTAPSITVQPVRRLDTFRQTSFSNGSFRKINFVSTIFEN